MPLEGPPAGGSPARRGWFRRRWPVVLVCGLAVLLLGAGAALWAVSRAGQRLVREQRCFAATVVACEVIATWAEQNRSWPSSWGDLGTLPARDFQSFAWPRDSAEIRSLVQVDFSLSLAAVGSQRPEAFAAVRPVFPSRFFDPRPVFAAFQERLSRVPGRR